ncbi:MAG: hypothetical protein A3J28_01575 [Acidobacteria bacterium RIFCSPLOWO2_12_FULL_60_22]|nr:MAG: hypothetical protein A3J28_01575 [Acidobacteria bacterium RIFCSPLOWO2_12_FULL_60_22]
MQIRIFVGTGGVGKTSVAAASALKTAVSGSKCLVLTIDPARRLRTALGITSGELEQNIPLTPFDGKGELWVALLDVAASLNRAVLRYAEPKQAKVVLEHPIYHILLQSLAGMQELMAIERIDQAIGDGFEAIFIDTAPSRHAFEFVDKPEYFAQLVSFPLVRLVGRTYHWWERSGLGRLSRKSFELYTRVEEMLGATLVRQILDFFSVFRSIAEGYARRAKRTIALLRDPQIAAFTVVTTPFKAKRDGEYFWEEMTKRKFRVGALVMNRCWPHRQVQLRPDTPAPVRDVVAWYENVSQAHQRIWDQVSADFAGRIPNRMQVPELSQDIDGLPALYQMAQAVDL